MLAVLSWAWDEAPRLGYLAFSGYSLLLVCTRWQATRVMTPDRRFLLLFFLLEIGTNITAGVLKLSTGVPLDVSSWLTVLCQSFLCAYLHYSIPRSFRSWRRRWRHLTARRHA